MHTKLKFYMALCLASFLCFAGCGSSGGSSNNDSAVKSGANDISSFAFPVAIQRNADSGIKVDAVGTINATDILVKVPVGTDIKKLVPEFTISDNSSVSANGQNIESGKTEIDFSSTVNFDVKADNGSTKTFKISVIFEVSYLKKIESGVFGVAAIKDDGTILYAPNPTPPPLDGKYIPFNQDSWKNIKDISVGEESIIGVTAERKVINAGEDYSYPNDIGAWTDIIQVTSAGESYMSLKSDGTVIAAFGSYPTSGTEAFLQEIASWTNIVQVSSDMDYAFGLTKDGTVRFAVDYYQSLSNEQLSLKDWASSLNDITKIATGTNDYTIFTVACLKKDGTVVGQIYGSDWTNNYAWNLKSFSFGSKVVDIAAGPRHVVGLKGDGTVVAYGDNSYGQCNVAGWTDIVAITAGTADQSDKTNTPAAWTIGVKKDGSIVVAGYNPFPEILSWNLNQ